MVCRAWESLQNLHDRRTGSSECVIRLINNNRYDTRCRLFKIWGFLFTITLKQKPKGVPRRKRWITKQRESNALFFNHFLLARKNTFTMLFIILLLFWYMVHKIVNEHKIVIQPRTLLKWTDGVEDIIKHVCCCLEGKKCRLV